MNKKTFKTIDDSGLIIKNRKSAVIFEIDKSHEKDKYKFLLKFSPEVFKELLEYVETISNESWINITPRECDSLGADYFEYYDREFDNNGCMVIKNNALSIERPCLESNKLYQFNKRKMESFIYDYRQMVSS